MFFVFLTATGIVTSTFSQEDFMSVHLSPGILILLLFSLYHFGSAQDEAARPDSLHLRADSLQRQADSLEQRASELEQQFDMFDTAATGDNDSGLTGEISRLKQEMVAVREKIKATVSDIVASVDNNKVREEEPAPAAEKVQVVIEEPEPKKGFGAFCLSFEYTAFDVDPLRHLAKHDRSLTGVPLSFSDNNMLTIGLMGYFSKDNSMRIGNGLSCGYKAFTSDIFTRPSDNSDTAQMSDSIVTLRVIPVNFGFLCEKALRYNPVDFFAGLMVGGHLTVVVKEEQAATLVSSFIGEESIQKEKEPRYSVALSPAVFWDLHGGIAFALSEKMHLGIDGVARFTYAYEGFGAGFGDYLSITPGIRMRLSFGSAG